FLLYFGILFLIGIVSYLKTKTSSEFMLGNRGVNYWVTAIAAHASDMSAWLFMAFPATIYTQGLEGAWIAIGLVGGMFLSWHFIAQKLRVATEQYQTVTLSSFLEKRFNDKKGYLGIASSIILMFFFSFYIGAGLTGMGRVFEAVFGINYHTGMVIGLGASLLYILCGGFIALVWNHFFQGMFLLAMIAIVPIISLYTLGSLQPIISYAAHNNISLSLIPSGNITTLIEMLNGIVWGVGYLGMPHVVVNYMGIDNPEHTKRAKYLGMTWLVISLLSAVAVGLVGMGLTPHLARSEMVFVQLVKMLFNPFFGGIILCAILAATMSTIDTQILVAANSITEDFYKKIITHKAHDKELIWVSRCSIILVALFGYAIGYRNSATVMGLVTYAWSGLGASFSPVVVAALYGKSIKSSTALTALIAGATVSALWPLLGTPLIPLIPGVLVSTALLYFKN
ncbi:MAG: sodium/proline symporter, partial [Candidatus Babeliales bacterium]